MKRNPILDGLRGWAALAVLWIHFPQLGDSGLAALFKKIPDWLDCGYLGVDVFFALSGYLITRIILEEKRAGRGSVHHFYFKRVLRIFPIYYLTVAVVTWLTSWEDTRWCWFYLDNFTSLQRATPFPLSHTWSLDVEEHFYLFWPLIVYLLDIKTSRRIIMWVIPSIAIATALSSEVLRHVTHYTYAHVVIYQLTPCRLLTLSLGAMLAYKEMEGWSIKRRWLCLGLLGIYVAIITAKNMDLFRPTLKMLAFAGVSITAVSYAVFHALKSRLAFWFLGNKTIGFIGTISYGLYLYHYPVLYFLQWTNPQRHGVPVPLATGLLVLALIFLIPIVSWFLIESPLLRLKARPPR